jgi:phosphohistidine phosphatase
VADGRVLWVLRHAKTVRRPPVGGADHERVLAARGRRDADALGARLGDGGDRFGLDPSLGPAVVLCSTAARAVETTERVLEQMSSPPPVTYLHSLYGASPEDVLERVSMVEEDVDSAMVVGHNPTFEALVSAMPRRPVASLSGGFATCGLAVFELPVARWDEIAPRTATVLGVFVPPFDEG